MYVDDEALSPDLIRGEWQLWQGPLEKDGKGGEGAKHADPMDAMGAGEGAWCGCEKVRVACAPLWVV